MSAEGSQGAAASARFSAATLRWMLGPLDASIVHLDAYLSQLGEVDDPAELVDELASALIEMPGGEARRIALIRNAQLDRSKLAVFVRTLELQQASHPLAIAGPAASVYVTPAYDVALDRPYLRLDCSPALKPVEPGMSVVLLSRERPTDRWVLGKAVGSDGLGYALVEPLMIQVEGERSSAVERIWALLSEPPERFSPAVTAVPRVVLAPAVAAYGHADAEALRDVLAQTSQGG